MQGLRKRFTPFPFQSVCCFLTLFRSFPFLFPLPVRFLPALPLAMFFPVCPSAFFPLPCYPFPLLPLFPHGLKDRTLQPPKRRHSKSSGFLSGDVAPDDGVFGILRTIFDLGQAFYLSVRRYLYIYIILFRDILAAAFHHLKDPSEPPTSGSPSDAQKVSQLAGNGSSRKLCPWLQ